VCKKGGSYKIINFDGLNKKRTHSPYGGGKTYHGSNQKDTRERNEDLTLPGRTPLSCLALGGDPFGGEKKSKSSIG